jgi:hypothetical protein
MGSGLDELDKGPAALNWRFGRQPMCPFADAESMLKPPPAPALCRTKAPLSARLYIGVGTHRLLIAIGAGVIENGPAIALYRTRRRTPAASLLKAKVEALRGAMVDCLSLH